MQEQDLVVRTLIVNEFDKRRAEVFDRVMQGGEAFIIKRCNRPTAMLIPVPEAFKREPLSEEAPGTPIEAPVSISGIEDQDKPNRANDIE